MLQNFAWKIIIKLLLFKDYYQTIKSVFNPLKTAISDQHKIAGTPPTSLNARITDGMSHCFLLLPWDGRRWWLIQTEKEHFRKAVHMKITVVLRTARLSSLSPPQDVPPSSWKVKPHGLREASLENWSTQCPSSQGICSPAMQHGDHAGKQGPDVGLPSIFRECFIAIS